MSCFFNGPGGVQPIGLVCDSLPVHSRERKTPGTMAKAKLHLEYGYIGVGWLNISQDLIRKKAKLNRMMSYSVYIIMSTFCKMPQVKMGYFSKIAMLFMILFYSADR